MQKPCHKIAKLNILRVVPPWLGILTHTPTQTLQWPLSTGLQALMVMRALTVMRSGAGIWRMLKPFTVVHRNQCVWGVSFVEVIGEREVIV